MSTTSLGFLRADVPIAAVACGAIASAVTYYVLRIAFQPVPTGPLVYKVQQKDSPIRPLTRFLLGEFPTIFVRNAGWSHRAYTKAARDAKGDKRAHAWYYGSTTATRLLITNAGDVDYILKNPSKFPKGETLKFLETFLGPNNLITIHDEEFHSKQFKNVGPAFNTANIRDMAATTVREHFTELLFRLRKETTGDQKLVMHSYWSDTALAIISEAAFSTKDFASMKDTLKKSTFAINPFMALSPWLYSILPTAASKRVKRIRQETYKRVTAVVQRFRAEHAKRGDDSEDDGAVGGKKLIDLLALNPNLTEAEIMDHSLTFVFGGHDTTAGGFNWLTYFLAKNPRVQNLLLEELKTAIPLDTTPTVATVQGLPYLRAVIDETLRCIPPIASLARQTTEDEILPVSGTFVPKGTGMAIPMNALHRDPDVYGSDADDFRPDRWVEDPDLKKRALPYNFMPFGSGKRACIGRDLAVHELLIGVAMIFRNFEVLWPEGEAEPFQMLGIVVRPRKPFHVYLRPRAD
jgi:cytochrome P450